MKNFILFIFLIFTSHELLSQKIAIRHDGADLGGQVNPVTIAEIPNGELKSVEKKWKSYLKKHGGKLSSDDGELFLDNGQVKAISNDTLDIFSRVAGSGATVFISIAVNKDGVFVNNSDGNSPSIDKFLYDFVFDIRKQMAEDELKSAEKLLKTRDKAYDSLLKSNKKLEKSIKKMREQISDNEREIKKNDEAIEKKKREISKQEALVKELERRLKSIE